MSIGALPEGLSKISRDMEQLLDALLATLPAETVAHRLEKVCQCQVGLFCLPSRSLLPLLAHCSPKLLGIVLKRNVFLVKMCSLVKMFPLVRMCSLVKICSLV